MQKLFNPATVDNYIAHIVVNFSSLISPEVYETAHKKWFDTVAEALKDEKIKEKANEPRDWDMVLDILEPYIPKINNRIGLARALYSFAVGSTVQEYHLERDFLQYMHKQKSTHKLGLVTSAAEHMIYEVFQDQELPFNNIVANILPETHHPKLYWYIQKFGTPDVYIGNNTSDLQFAKKNNLVSITTGWFKEPKKQGDYHVRSVDELYSIKIDNS